MDDLDLGATIKGFAPGQKVFDRFTLRKILGRGGMGVVWLAQDEELEREVALKFLPEILALDRESVVELKRETRRNLDLTHPHIVRIYDFLQDTRSAAISMEYVNGSSISSAKVDQTDGVFPLETVERWMVQLCEAMSYAHESARVVHRDLKPANLMVDTSGRLKITDFGIACSISDSVSRVSKNMGSSGTPVYMSPQQMMGERPSPADDIYSIGATLYELLTGKPPFYSGNVILQVQNKLPPSIRERRAELGVTDATTIPEVWESVIASCLAKDSAQRPASVAAIAAALKLSGNFTPAALVPVAANQTKGEAARVVAEIPPAAPAKRAPIRLPWYAVVAAVVVIGAGAFWLGDVPNRWRASKQFDSAQKSLLASNWGDALSQLRETVALRPADADYRREYAAAQQRWLDMLKQEIAPLDPLAAYDRVGARAAIAVSLIDPYAQDYRQVAEKVETAARATVNEAVSAAAQLAEQRSFAEAYQALGKVRDHAALSSDFARIENEVRVSEVHAGMDLAREAGNQQDYASAYAALEQVKTHSALVPEYATLLQDLKEAEVRNELSAALALAQKDEYAEALAALEATAKRQILPEEVKATEAQVRQLAENYSIARLGRTIAAGKAEATQEAIVDYAKFTGSTFDVTGEALVAERNLGRFLTQLESLRLRPAANAARKHWRDVVLVAAGRARFDSPTEVQAFLADHFSQWSRQLADEGKPALALYVDELARKEGAAVDNTWTARQVAQLPARAGLKLALAPVAGAQGHATLAEKPVNTFREALGQRVGAWLPLSTNEPDASTVKLVLELKGPTKADKPKTERQSVRYQSGTERVRNDAYYNLQNDLSDAKERLAAAIQQYNETKAQAEQTARQAGQNGVSSGGAFAIALAGGVSIAAAQSVVDNARKSVNEISEELRNTPSTLSQPVYSDEGYDYITHNVTYTAEFAVTPYLPGDKLQRGAGWSEELSHQTVEVTGNRSRGVPVQAPSYPSASQIEAKLADGLTAQVTSGMNFFHRQLAAATFKLLEMHYATAASPVAAVDRNWALVLLWRGVKVEPPNADAYERANRQALGLTGF